ncbi:hypothetical protein SDC9_127146 [bioreactor metagenome]|uniref:Uncharacterized protein n=1 Tax=bioreactor metagenome TaxID=1076179 RepID=A0A645CSI4_9ZZZZ
MRGRVVVTQRRGELVHEIGAVGESGQRVAVGFAAYLLKAGGLFGEHGFEPVDHGVHGAGHALQFGNFRFGQADEAAFADRLRLADDGIERALDAAQQLHAEDLGVEGDRAVEIDDAEHGVQDAHEVSFQNCGSCRPRWRSSRRRARQSGQSCSTTDQKRGLWFISLRCASSWQTT